MKPQDRRCRTIVTHEGKFLNLDDFKDALTDKDFVMYCAEMLVVGKRLNAPENVIIAQVIGCALITLSGELPKELAKEP